MSDTIDDFYGRQLLRKSKTNPLRARLEGFVAEHERDVDLVALREAAGEGEALSRIVKDERSERV
jgi:hypothetical protein